MKRILGLVTVLAALALGMNAVASTNQLFGTNNLIIYRIGDGSTQYLTNTGNSVYLDEYTTASIWSNAGSSTPPVPVRSILMPTNWVGIAAPLLANGAAFGEGAMTRSVDQRFIVVPGFGATFGQFTNNSISGASCTNSAGQTNVARVVGLVDGYGNIYTTTVQTNGNEQGDDLRTAASTDGTNIWLAGDAKGGKYTTRGSMVSTQVEEAASNSRVLGIYGNGTNANTLFFSANTRVGCATNPAGTLPTTFIKGNFTNLPGVFASGQGSPWAFALLNMGGSSGPDTLYVCDNVTNAPGEPLGRAGGVLKYCYVPASNAWVEYGYVYAVGATGLAAMQNGTNVDLYITEGGTATPSYNIIYPYTDVTGYMGNIQNSPSQGRANGNAEPLQPPGVNRDLTNTRGITFAPLGGDSGSLSGPGVISVGPPYGPNFSGPKGGPFTPTNFTYSVGNLGTNDTNFTIVASAVPWLTVTPTGGTVNHGTFTTVTITPNATASSTNPGYYAGNISFRTGNTLSQAVTPSLSVYAFDVLPSSNFVVQALVGGFTATNMVYTVTNLTAVTYDWCASTSTNWNSLSPSTQLNYVSNSLAGGKSTNVTVYIVPSAANSLVAGVYEDVLVFTNTDINTEITRHYIDVQAGFGFFDDFSKFTQNANLVGQKVWFAPSSTMTANPLQVSGGAVVQPGGCNPPDSTSSQAADKNFATANVTNTSDSVPWIYAGMIISVTSASASTPPNYTLSFYQAFGNGYATGNLSMSDVGGNQFTYNCQVNNGAGIVVHGNQKHNYGDTNEVYLVVDAGDSNAFLFVNSGGGGWDAANIFNNTASLEAQDSPSGFPAGYDPGMGSWHIGNYCAGVAQEGFQIMKLAVSTNYVDVYNFLHAAPGCSPLPGASFTVNHASGPAPLQVIFSDTSTGSPTAWYWDFDVGIDDMTSTIESPTNTYAAPGTYTAQLISSNACGTSTNSTTISVYEPYAWWRLSYYGSTNNASGAGNLDPYGSGMSNTNKFLAGFATNSAAYLQIISIAKTNTSDIRVIYLGASGDNSYFGGPTTRTNVLESTTGLSNGSYSSNNFTSTGQTNVLIGGNGLGSVATNIDTGGAASVTSRYYRVRVLVP